MLLICLELVTIHEMERLRPKCYPKCAMRREPTYWHRDSAPKAGSVMISLELVSLLRAGGVAIQIAPSALVASNPLQRTCLPAGARVPGNDR
jgi:hypothetical protein